MKKCLKCNTELSDDAIFCLNCGAKLDAEEQIITETPITPTKMQYCKKCGAEVAEGTFFCPNCGTKSNKFAATPRISGGEKFLRVINVLAMIVTFFIGVCMLFLTIIGVDMHFISAALILLIPILLIIFVFRKKQMFKIKKKINNNAARTLTVILIYILMPVIMIGNVGVSAIVEEWIMTGQSIPSQANEAERELINYILENGEYDAENEVYAIDESTMESGIYFNYIIEYSTDTKKLTFKENQAISEISTYIFTTMYYEYGASEQKVEVNMVMDSQYGVKSSGVIRPATYTGSNRTIYSFQTTSNHANIKEMTENNVYSMLNHCQLLLIDAGTGLVPFGFEKGLFK